MKIFTWTLHWFLQGLKMWLFLWIPIIILSLFNGAGAAVYELIETKFDDSTLWMITATTTFIILLIAGIAVSTFCFAEQLKRHPFRPYKPKD